MSNTPASDVGGKIKQNMPEIQSKLLESAKRYGNSDIQKIIADTHANIDLQEYIRKSVNYERAIELVKDIKFEVAGEHIPDASKIQAKINQEYAGFLEKYEKKFKKTFSKQLKDNNLNKESLSSIVQKIFKDEKDNNLNKESLSSIVQKIFKDEKDIIFVNKKNESGPIRELIQKSVNFFREESLNAEGLSGDDKKLIIEKYNGINDKISDLYVPNSRDMLKNEDVLAKVEQHVNKYIPEPQGYVERLKLRTESMAKGVSSGDSYIMSERLGKTRILAGATVALGGAIIGGKDMVQAFKGKEADEKGNGASRFDFGKFAIGAGKLTAALAIASRLATGRIGTVFGQSR